MCRLSLLTVVVVLVSLCCTAAALDNGQALRPQMGWNSWNHFGCGIDESLIRATAKTIVDSGLAKAGYQYVNLDDCWAVSRDSETRVLPDPKGFPSGMFALGSYIHSLGLKFGVYSDAGNEVRTHRACGRQADGVVCCS
jgi:alpha-galactosidase